MNHEEKKTTKAGNLGELIAAKILLTKNLEVKRTFISRPHLFDFILVNTLTGKIEFLADIKTKIEREIRNDSGIDDYFYNTYKKASEVNNLPFLLIFVDYRKKVVYGNTIEYLDDNCNPHKLEGKIYWDTDNMIVLGKLSDDEAKELKLLDERSSDYGGNKKKFDKNYLLKRYNEFKKGGENGKEVT